jgi:wnt family
LIIKYLFCIFSDNLKYGVGFARNFVDVVEKKKPGSVRARMNLHNNAVGRQVVSNLMRMQCRCHGVSGSCELKTCWQTMPPFSEIGDLLKHKYRAAVPVRPVSEFFVHLSIFNFILKILSYLL